MLPALIFNFDDVSFMLDGKTLIPKVFVPKCVADEFAEENHAMKKTQKASQVRCLTLFNCIAADGARVHTAVKIRDSDFVDLQIIEVNSTMSVWLIPPGWNHGHFVGILFKKFVLPLVEEKRQKLQEVENAGVCTWNFSKPGVDVKPVFAKPSSSSIDNRAVFCLDGEQYKTREMMEQGLGEILKVHKIEYLKSAAQCTPFQQALDKGNIHKTLKAIV